MDTKCKHPLKAFRLGINSETGKSINKITKYDTEFIWWNEDDLHWYQSTEPIDKFPHLVNRAITDWIEIPCGKCVSCRLKRSKEWALRCSFEAEVQAQRGFKSWFVTLTYDDEHLPSPLILCDNDGLVNFESPIHPLVRKDVQDFLKRLRYYFPDNKIRYFGCGEYGPENMRPHYHLILFGFNFTDLYPFGRNELGQVYFRSPILEKCWFNGFSCVSENTFETSAYTARYILKKQLGETSDIYENLLYIPEFSMMSLKPGIAAEYFEQHKDTIYLTDEVFAKKSAGSVIHSKPPRYFDRLYDIDNPEAFAIIKEDRISSADASKAHKLDNTSLSYIEQLQVEEDNLNAKLKNLRRTL